MNSMEIFMGLLETGMVGRVREEFGHVGVGLLMEVYEAAARHNGLFSLDTAFRMFANMTEREQDEVRQVVKKGFFSFLTENNLLVVWQKGYRALDSVLTNNRKDD